MWKSLIQWASLNGIIVNGIIRLTGSNWSKFTNAKLVFYILYKYLVHSLIGIIWLMGSVKVWPKVILLIGFHCTVFLKYFIGMKKFLFRANSFLEFASEDNYFFLSCWKVKGFVWKRTEEKFISFLFSYQWKWDSNPPEIKPVVVLTNDL